MAVLHSKDNAQGNVKDCRYCGGASLKALCMDGGEPPMWVAVCEQCGAYTGWPDAATFEELAVRMDMDGTTYRSEHGEPGTYEITADGTSLELDRTHVRMELPDSAEAYADEALGQFWLVFQQQKHARPAPNRLVVILPREQLETVTAQLHELLGHTTPTFSDGEGQA